MTSAPITRPSTAGVTTVVIGSAAGATRTRIPAAPPLAPPAPARRPPPAHRRRSCAGRRARAARSSTTSRSSGSRGARAAGSTAVEEVLSAFPRGLALPGARTHAQATQLLRLARVALAWQAVHRRAPRGEQLLRREREGDLRPPRPVAARALIPRRGSETGAAGVTLLRMAQIPDHATPAAALPRRAEPDPPRPRASRGAGRRAPPLSGGHRVGRDRRPGDDLPAHPRHRSGRLGIPVPDDAPAIRAEARSAALFGYPLISRTLVVQRDPGGPVGRRTAPPSCSGSWTSTGIATPPSGDIAAAVPLVDDLGLAASPGQEGTTAITYLFFRPEISPARAETVAGPLRGLAARRTGGRSPA